MCFVLVRVWLAVAWCMLLVVFADLYFVLGVDLVILLIWLVGVFLHRLVCVLLVWGLVVCFGGWCVCGLLVV